MRDTSYFEPRRSKPRPGGVAYRDAFGRSERTGTTTMCGRFKERVVPSSADQTYVIAQNDAAGVELVGGVRALGQRANSSPPSSAPAPHPPG